jgi:hypothetical protein
MAILTSIETMLPENPEWQAQCQRLHQAESLTSLVWIAFQMGLWLAKDFLEGELTQRSELVTVWPTCAECGKRLRSKGYRPRQMTTLVGEIH